MSLEILPYSTPTGIRQYVPLEDYQRALDNLDKLEAAVAELNERMTTEVKSYMTSMAELRAENRRLQKELDCQA